LTVATTIALFLPLFLCMELVMAAPGRDRLEDVLKCGLRNFGRHVTLLVLGAVAFHLVTGWFVGRAPL
jgi:hypothetical protein